MMVCQWSLAPVAQPSGHVRCSLPALGLRLMLVPISSTVRTALLDEPVLEAAELHSSEKSPVVKALFQISLDKSASIR
jgi:hypothetical protein